MSIELDDDGITTVLYIAPSSGETHNPQARIYVRTFASVAYMRSNLSVRDMYRLSPQKWVECGLINYSGRLVCFEGSDEQLQVLLAASPLAAGLVFIFNGVTDVNTSFRSMCVGGEVNLQNIPKEKPMSIELAEPDKYLSGSEYHRTLRTMQCFGGGFAWNIANAGFVADNHNCERLQDAFPELFSKYGPGTDFYKAVIAD